MAAGQCPAMVASLQWVESRHSRRYFRRMKRSPLAPDIFPIALAGLGCVLLAFPSLRVAGALAVFLAVIYWVVKAVLKMVRR